MALPESPRILRPPWGPFLSGSFHMLWSFRASLPAPHLIPSHPTHPLRLLQSTHPLNLPRDPGICTPRVRQAWYSFALLPQLAPSRDLFSTLGTSGTKIDNNPFAGGVKLSYWARGMRGLGYQEAIDRANHEMHSFRNWFPCYEENKARRKAVTCVGICLGGHQRVRVSVSPNSQSSAVQY